MCISFRVSVLYFGLYFAPDFRFGNAYNFCAGFLFIHLQYRFYCKIYTSKIYKGYNFFYFGFCSLLVILSTVMLFSFNTLILPAKINRSNFNGKVQMDYYSINNTKYIFQ